MGSADDINMTTIQPSPPDQKTGATSDTIESVSPERPPSNSAGKDKAAQMLKEAAAAGHTVLVSAEDNRRVLRKIDTTALSYASVFGLIQDTHLVGDEYSWLGSIVYVAQLVMQPLVAYFLVKLPMGKFCGGMVLCWGIVLCGMVAAKNFAGLMATRFLLGAFEAAVAPAFIAIVQMWYRRSEQTNRNASWYAMLGVINILGSLLTYGLGHIDSPHLHSYQIIFLFCGLLTLVFSVFLFLFMPDSPTQAKFLSYDEKLIAIERLRMNQMGISSGEWKWDHVKETFLDVKTWLWFFMLTAISIPSGGVSTFGPLIIKSFGFNSFTTILFNMPFGAVQMIATLGGAYLATRYKRKSPILIGLCIPPIIGISMLLAIPYEKKNRAALLVGYYLVSFYPGISPLIYSWSGQNTGGDTKRKVTTGFLFVGASAGNIIGPHLYQPSQAPHYRPGLISNLILFIVIIALVLCGCAWVKVLNVKHAAMRERLGKSAKIVDLSMEAKGELKARNEAVNEIEGEAAVGEKAFDDVTDLKNEDFIYLY
ncbi:hypothetical protein H2203_003639 [Taxawa tesnikishii (nom. ined.)]|nr:hypothetical protein H2203_003639 [Dothideales sp. JES 119]